MAATKPAAAAAAAAALSAISLGSVVVGAKRPVDNDNGTDSEQKQNKKPAPYKFCCVNAENPWTRRCLPIESAAAQEMSQAEKENKCFPTQSSCEATCEKQALLPPIMKIIFDYEPVVLGPAFDIKQTEEHGFATFTAEQIRAQSELNRLLDELDVLFEESHKTSNDEKIDQLRTQIQETLTVMRPFVSKGIIEVKTIRRLVAIFNDLDQMGRQEYQLYDALLNQIPNKAQLVFELFFLVAATAPVSTWYFARLPEKVFHNLPVLSQQEYFFFFQKYERDLNDKITAFTNEQIVNDLRTHWRTEFVYLYFPNDRFVEIMTYFPVQFCLALFQYIMQNSQVTLWKWDELITAILPRLSLPQGEQLLQQLQSLRVASLKTDAIAAPTTEIQVYAKKLQTLAWQDYDKEIVGIENHWREGLKDEAAPANPPANAGGIRMGGTIIYQMF